MSRGFWIVLDGPNGVGKSGAIAGLSAKLRALGYDVVDTREPGGSPLAEKIRGLILDSDNEMDSVTQLLLFNAARRSHLNATIRPALAAGKVVLCDRFLASSVVFQSLNSDGSPNLRDDFIIDTHERYCDGMMPDLSIYLDAPLEIRRQRLAGRAAQAAVKDRFEEYDDRFDLAAAEKFSRCGPILDRDFDYVDTTGSPEQVIEAVLAVALSRLPSPSSLAQAA